MDVVGMEEKEKEKKKKEVKTRVLVVGDTK